MKSTNWLKLLVGDIQTDRQTGDLINLLSFLESRLKTKELHNLYSSPDIISQVKANEVGGACGTHGRGEKSVQGFGGKARRKETTWKTKAWVGGWDQNGS
jgi:hypothetical protein